MKAISKLLSLVLLFVSLVVVLTSCDPEQFNTTYEINLDVDLNQKIDLNVLYPNSGMTNTEFANGRTTRYFEELTGYKVKYEQVLGDQTTVLQNILADQQQYHMLKLESGTYMAAVSNDSFVDLKPALEKFGKNLLATIPQEAWDAVTIDGKIYAIPEIGYGQMISSGLIWNMRQLNEVGITEVPQTFSEVHDAFYALQNHFSKGNDQYHAFAMQSAQAYIEPFAAAFDLNKDFYVNEKGEVAHAMYQEKYDDYMTWLYTLVQDKVISREWEGYSGMNLVEQFAKGNLGCGYMPYWHINSLVESLAASAEYSSEDEARASIDWTLTVRGDGSHGTVEQTKAKTLYYESIGYYITVPAHMAEYGAYVIDWCDKRITEDGFIGYRLGDEGVHFNYTDASNPNGIEVTLKGETKYIELLPAYDTDILPTSMYQTGVNPAVAKELWILSEQSYKCWTILIDTDYDNIVGNAISMAPYIEGWSEIDILSRSWVITYEQKMINAEDKEKFDKVLASIRSTWTRSYWTEEVNANVQNWYKNKNK